MTELPLFPLSSVVMPEGLLPLRLFEPRYIDMVKNCFKTDSGFGVCLTREGSEVGQAALPYPMGTLVHIVDFDQGADGLLHITGKGGVEFDLLEWRTESDGLLVGQVEDQQSSVSGPVLPVHASLATKLETILRYVESHISYDDEKLDEDVWVCNRLIELLPLDAPSKYAILALRETEARLDALSELQFTVENTASE